MTALATAWGTLFRLFPCPTGAGLRPIGRPHRQSPVLVTCNFHLTVERLVRILEAAEIDAWLLVADSKGVNVWCAAGADDFNTRSVASVVKTSGIAAEVDHRTLILPPLGAPAIQVDALRRQTGWTPRWGPVRAEDLPRFLTGPRLRREADKRVSWTLPERLDTALGSLFPFYALGGLGFALFRRKLLGRYLVIGAATFVGFMAACPHLPGRKGLTKVMPIELALATVLALSEMLSAQGSPLRRELVLAMVTLLIWASELGGLAPNLPSDLDPLLARLGIRRIGNTAFAGTVRTDLLNRFRELSYDRGACNGCRRCFEVCPLGVWEMDAAKRARLARIEDCTACGACLTQCPTAAVRAPRVDERT